MRDRTRSWVAGWSVAALLLLLPTLAAAQCANNNTLYITVTPPCPGTGTVPCVYGGEYVLVNVTAGNTYTFSTCGGAAWDTQITLYNNAGGGSLGYNDDGCGAQSTVTWTATFTGQLRVLVDLYNCVSNASCADLLIACSTSGGGCLPGELADCNGNCAPASWVGDGFCDDGSFTYNGVPIFLNCAALNNDDGDCGPAGCPPGEVPDCNGNCAPSGWIGDGSCDDGSFSWNGVPIYFDCFAFASDGGDCGDPGDPGGCAPGVGGSALPGSGSIQVQQTMTPQQLISNVFLGECLSASGITFTGATGAIGTFSNGWGIGIPSGIIMTSGSAALAAGPNAIGSSGTDNAAGGNALLNGLVPGYTTQDAAVFTFTFTPQTAQVTFTYVFASEEYPEFVCLGLNDVFGFFVSGPGYAANTNIALVPGAYYPVSVDHVNNVGGCGPYSAAHYVAGNFNNTQYDGFTVPLTACINTVPCATYTITIAIADVGDGIYDSAVFLAAQSFSAGVDLEIGADSGGGASSEEECMEQGEFVFTIDQPLDEPTTLVYEITQAGGAIFDPPIPITVTIPAGQTTVSLPISALPSSLTEDASTVTLVLSTGDNPGLGCSCTSDVITATLYLCDPLVLPVEWLGFDATLANGEREVLCAWVTASELNNDHFTVERSHDGHHWEDVGVVPGAGTITTPRYYELTDHAPLPGISYYRVRQTDINGDSGHSVTRTVRRQTLFGVHPNPGNGVFRVTGHEGGTLTIFDAVGRRVPFTLGADGELVLHGAAAGTYVAELVHEQRVEPLRVRIVVR